MVRGTWEESEFNQDGTRVELKDRLDGWKAELEVEPAGLKTPNLMRSTAIWALILAVAVPLLALTTFFPVLGWIPALTCLGLAAWFGFSRSDLAVVRVQGFWWPEVAATAFILIEAFLLLYLVRPGLGCLAAAAWMIGFYAGIRRHYA